MWTQVRQVLQTAKRNVPWLEAIASLGLSRRVFESIAYREMKNRPDRVYLEKDVLPFLVSMPVKSVLFVGCAAYATRYPRYLAAHDIDCWTIDIDPRCERWGISGRHVVGDIKNAHLHFPAASFDAVMLGGVFGFGVDTLEDMSASLRSVARILKEGAILVIQWCRDRTPDPLGLEDLNRLFLHGTASRHVERIGIHSHPHDCVYDFFLRRPLGSEQLRG
jgi:SAM-dependent methyltransferase